MILVVGFSQARLVTNIASERMGCVVGIMEG